MNADGETLFLLAFALAAVAFAFVLIYPFGGHKWRVEYKDRWLTRTCVKCGRVEETIAEFSWPRPWIGIRKDIGTKTFCPSATESSDAL